MIDLGYFTHAAVSFTFYKSLITYEDSAFNFISTYFFSFVYDCMIVLRFNQCIYIHVPCMKATLIISSTIPFYFTLFRAIQESDSHLCKNCRHPMLEHEKSSQQVRTCVHPYIRVREADNGLYHVEDIADWVVVLRLQFYGAHFKIFRTRCCCYSCYVYSVK